MCFILGQPVDEFEDGVQKDIFKLRAATRRIGIAEMRTMPS